jgi:predicted dehydrogenase
MKAGAPRSVIVGAGVMGRWHAAAVSRVGGRVSAVVDPDAARAQRIARRHAGCQVFAGLDEAAAAGDVVHVCTPTGSHADLVTRAIAAGCHVLVEKPLAGSAAETARLFDLAVERSVVLCPVHQFVFQHGIQRALARLPAMGPLRDVQLTFCSAGAQGRSDAVHDAIAFEILPHPFSLLARMFPAGFPAFRWSVVRPYSGELRVWTFVEGVSISIRISMRGRPASSSVVVIGERGTIVADLFHGFSVRQSGAVSPVRKILQPFRHGLSLTGTAAVNLMGRAAKREYAYPGLAELIRRLYAAADGSTAAPISREEAVAVAAASDTIGDAIGRPLPVSTGQSRG